jgi:hypothetical protein
VHLQKSGRLDQLIHLVREGEDQIDFVLRENNRLSSVAATKRNISVGPPTPQCLPGKAQPLGHLCGGEELNAFDG